MNIIISTIILSARARFCEKTRAGEKKAAAY
jgi:hypothetical protein